MKFIKPIKIHQNQEKMFQNPGKYNLFWKKSLQEFEKKTNNTKKQKTSAIKGQLILWNLFFI